MGSGTGEEAGMAVHLARNSAGPSCPQFWGHTNIYTLPILRRSSSMRPIAMPRLALLPAALLLALSAAQAATLTVTSGADSGPGSLRQALADAQPGDAIVFSGVGTVALNGPLTLDKNVAIHGPGVTLDGQLKGRVLQVEAGVNAALTGLVITNGLLAGRGIDYNGTELSGSALGAGIYNAGSLSLADVQVRGNFATGGGGGGAGTWGGGGGGSGVKNAAGAKGAGGDGGAGAGGLGGSGAIETPTGGGADTSNADPGLNGAPGGNGSNGGGAGGGASATYTGSGGGGGGWAGAGGGGGRGAGGGGGYGGGGGGAGSAKGGGSNGSVGGTASSTQAGAGGTASAGGDSAATSGGTGGGGGYAAMGGLWLGGGGGAGGTGGSNGGAAAGGIYNAPGATLSMSGAACLVQGNLAAGGGGAGWRFGGHAVGGLWNAGALTIAPECGITGNAAGAGRHGQQLGVAASAPDSRTDAALQVSVDGGGSVTIDPTAELAVSRIRACTSAGGPACQAVYLPGTTVTLVASVPANQHVRWSGDCTASSSDPKRATLTTNGATACHASFVDDQHVVTTRVTPALSGTLSCDSPVNDGETTTCQARPAAGYDTAGISGCDSPATGAQVNSYTTLPITRACEVAAEFALKTYTITGTVSGLTGGNQVALASNGANPLTLGNGPFSFSATHGSGYAITVQTQPTGQTCMVANGSGTITDNVAGVLVTCATNTYAIGGSVGGLTGTGLVLQNNGGDDLAISASGAFTFADRVAHGGDYAVTVGTQPDGQVCTVANGSGSGITADVGSVQVACAPYVVGTTVPASGPGGPASATFTGGGALCRFDTAATGFEAAPAQPPAGQTMPQGAFRFRLTGCDVGALVTMTVTWPEPVTGYTKYGKASRTATQDSYFAPASLAINGSAVSFTVTDGELGDDDWTADGHITDPSGPTLAAVAAPPQAIPTLPPWGLVLLAMVLGILGLQSLLHKRRQL